MGHWQWQSQWNFCNVDGDGEVSRNEIITCSAKASNYFGMPESVRNLLYELLLKEFCVKVDEDRSGVSSYDEFRYTFDSFGFYAGFMIWWSDHDDNRLFNGDEAEAWDDYFTDTGYEMWDKYLAEITLEMSDEERACVESAMYNVNDLELWLENSWYWSR